MKHTEYQYFDLGYRYQRAVLRDQPCARSLAAEIRALLESERIKDQPEARHLISRGRDEARVGR